jgi:hypothetical protein
MNAVAGQIASGEHKSFTSASSARTTDATQAPLRSGMGAALFAVATMVMMYLGWQWRDAGYLTAERGLGYTLGIVGGVLMTLLLLYPLRKKQVKLFRWGPIRYWFRLHMLFGVLGPLTILFHSNFKLGAINSNVALISMLLVAGSGLIGRYIYTRIHYGLYGAHVTLSGLQERIAAAKGGFANLFRSVPEAAETLARLESWLLRERSGLVRSLTFPWVVLRCWYARRRIIRLMHRKLVRHGSKSDWSQEKTQRAQRVAARFVAGYIDNLRRVAEIGTYERMFAWWHILHLPLFLMMLLAGIVHVIAVHMY